MPDGIKKPNKTGEMVLGLLGVLGNIGGKLAFGPDFDIDLGTPFAMGSQFLKRQREEKEAIA